LTDVDSTTPPDALIEVPQSQPAADGRLRRVFSWLGNAMIGTTVTVLLVAIALGLGIATFVLLARGSPFGLEPGLGVGLVLANLSVLLLLGAVLAGRLTRVWVERRRGAAGARLHVRLVLLFAGVAVVPTILVGAFAAVFFHFGIQSWFNDPVRAALTESLLVARGYVDEHRNNIRAAVLEMATDLNRAGVIFSGNPTAFGEVLGDHTSLRGLTEAVIYEPVTGQVLATAGLLAGVAPEPPPGWATARAGAADLAR